MENYFFKVPRHHFESSEIFRDMFQLPIAEGVQPDGFSKEQPLRLGGIKKGDFQQLLRIMYPRYVMSRGSGQHNSL